MIIVFGSGLLCLLNIMLLHAVYIMTAKTEDATDVPITLSLQEALRQFGHSHTIRRLFADALCIIQGEVVEKSEQVKHMGWAYWIAMKASI